MTAEAKVLAETRLRAGKIGYVLWRNNRGKFYGYGIVRAAIAQLAAGNWKAALATLTKARPVDCGVGADGAGDLIGYASIVITPEMVGRTIAVFASVECKKGFGGVIDPNQHEFAARVRDRGGIAEIVTDAVQLQPPLQVFLESRREDSTRKT